MNRFDPNLARLVTEDRIRDTDQRRLARETRRREQPSAATATVRRRRSSRLWSLLHVRHAYS